MLILCPRLQLGIQAMPTTPCLVKYHLPVHRHSTTWSGGRHEESCPRSEKHE